MPCKTMENAFSSSSMSSYHHILLFFHYQKNFLKFFISKRMARQPSTGHIRTMSGSLWWTSWSWSREFMRVRRRGWSACATTTWTETSSHLGFLNPTVSYMTNQKGQTLVKSLSYSADGACDMFPTALHPWHILWHRSSCQLQPFSLWEWSFQ